MSVLLPIILRWISSPVCALYWQANGSHALWHLLQFAQKIVASGYSRPFLSVFGVGWDTCWSKHAINSSNLGASPYFKDVRNGKERGKRLLHLHCCMRSTKLLIFIRVILAMAPIIERDETRNFPRYEL